MIKGPKNRYGDLEELLTVISKLEATRYDDPNLVPEVRFQFFSGRGFKAFTLLVFVPEVLVES